MNTYSFEMRNIKVTIRQFICSYVNIPIRFMGLKIIYHTMLIGVIVEKLRFAYLDASNLYSALLKTFVLTCGRGSSW